ncbi:MAG TPA: type II toxin-antitoxin system VapC family toxin [Candidatus Angelobacter sp.]|nr:type II toxin-antitoxin system VapC family toxin [Candidatus Angelobacter sp.]
MNYLLDTSAWLRSALNPGTLPRFVNELAANPAEILGVSIFSFWEVAKKNQNGKLPLPRDLPEWFNAAVTQNVRILPLTPEIIVEAARLPDFPTNDPADEIIVATARVHKLTIVTSDTKMKGYKHAKVQYFTPILTS